MGHKGDAMSVDRPEQLTKRHPYNVRLGAGPRPWSNCWTYEPKIKIEPPAWCWDMQDDYMFGLELKPKRNGARRKARLRELNGAFIYRSPSSNTELPTKAIGNPTVSVSMEMETAEENEREARQYAKEAKRRVLSLIQMARTADQKVLLMRRYIDGMSWEDAAEAAGKSRTWATNTHGEALLYIRLPDAVKKQ